MSNRTRLGWLSCWCTHLSWLWLLRGPETWMDYLWWRFVDVCWQQAKRSVVLPNALPLHPGNHDYFHCSWFGLRNETRICTAVKPQSPTMSYSHAFPCPFTLLSSRVCLTVFFSFHVSLLFCSHIISFIINMLFANSRSYMQTTHSGMHAFTCM